MTKKKTKKKTVTRIPKKSKEKKIFDILKQAAYAWDVYPHGTIEENLLKKLVQDILKIK